MRSDYETLPRVLHFSTAFTPVALLSRHLHFNPIQIAEWLAEMLGRKEFGTQRALSHELGVSRTRVGQFLNLLRLPSGRLSELKAVEGLTEYQFRPIVVMTPSRQARAIRSLLARTN